LAAGLLVVSVPAWIHLLSLLKFFAGVQVNARVLFIVAAFAAAGTVWLCARRDRFRIGKRQLVWIAAAQAAFILLGLALTLHTFDFSYDGSSYHAPAIQSLRKGWNPLVEQASAHWPVPSPGWYLDHYPKFGWIVGANLAELTGTTLGARMLDFILLAGTVPILFDLLRQWGYGARSSALLSGLFALNPVVLVQSLSLYTDGEGYLLIWIALAGMLGVIQRRGITPWILFAIGLTGMINVKFPYLFWGGLFTACAVSILAWRRQWKPVLGLAALALALTVLTGWEPYVSNWIERGHPLFPAYGAASPEEDAMKLGKIATYGLDPGISRAEAWFYDSAPPDLRGKNRFRKWYLSTFADPRGTSRERKSKRVFPFDFRRISFSQYTQPTIRVAGFGPFFAAMLVLGLVPLAEAPWRRRPESRMQLGLWLLLGVTVFGHPEGWFARYVPQMWALPLLAAALGRCSRWRWSRVCANLVIALALIDVLGIGWMYFRAQFRLTRALDGQIAEIMEHPIPVEIAFRYPYNVGFAAILEERGVRLKPVDDADCQGDQPFLGKLGRICARSIPEPGSINP
jgi:biotin transporter BioY